MKTYRIHFLNAYNEECQTTQSGLNEKDARKNFENWMPEGTIQSIEELGSTQMRKPDAIYTDILPRDIDLYVNQPDEECHKLESVTGPEGEQRFNILIWLKEDN